MGRDVADTVSLASGGWLDQHVIIIVVVVLIHGGRRGFSGAEAIAHLGGGVRRGRRHLGISFRPILVHVDQDRGSLEQLHLLMLGDQQLGSNSPCGIVFPPRNPEKKRQPTAIHEEEDKGDNRAFRGTERPRRRPRTEPTWRILVPMEPAERVAGRGRTHICLDKQLPCLYPFPQRSQRSSGAERLPSPFIRCDPSLARRFRFLVVTGLVAGVMSSAGGAAEPSWEWEGEVLRATGGSWLGLFILRERYEPKPEGAPTELDSRPLRLPRRRAGMGTVVDSSFKEAATAAAAALAAAVVTLFRRVTRWLWLTAPREMEWAWRGLDWGRGRERDNSCSGDVSAVAEVVRRESDFKGSHEYVVWVMDPEPFAHRLIEADD